MRVAAALVICVWLTQAATAAPLRTWTSKDGKYSTKAQYVDLRGSNVLLLKEDGRLISVPFEKLSTTDNKYIVAQIRADVRAEAAPPPAAAALPAPAAQPAVPPKINVVVGEDGDLKARNDQATEDARKAALRREQSGVDTRATKLNTRRAEILARGQQITIEKQQLEQQVLAEQNELARRNVDMREAEAAGAWEYVQGHQTQIALLRDRMASKRQRHGELTAEFVALSQEEATIRQQVAALEHDYHAIEDEIIQPPQQQGRAGKRLQ